MIWLIVAVLVSLAASVIGTGLIYYTDLPERLNPELSLLRLEYEAMTREKMHQELARRTGGADFSQSAWISCGIARGILGKGITRKICGSRYSEGEYFLTRSHLRSMYVMRTKGESVFGDVEIDAHRLRYSISPTTVSSSAMRGLEY